MPVSVVAQDASGNLPSSDDAALWAEGLGLNFPVVADVKGQVFSTWDPDSVLPWAAIIDQDGVVAWAEVGGSGSLEEIEAEVVALLEEPE